MDIAERTDEIYIKEDFLYLKDQQISVRRREGDQPTNIQFICDEEITNAVNMVIKHQFATPPEELIRQVAKLFGIKVIRAATAERIENIINGLITNGKLEKTSKGMINFPSN